MLRLRLALLPLPLPPLLLLPRLTPPLLPVVCATVGRAERQICCQLHEALPAFCT